MSARTLAVVLALALVPVVTVLPADQPAEAQTAKATVCHRTRSLTNPYRRISVAQAALTGQRGHGSHGAVEGVWDGVKGSWGDIIPDTTNTPRNWTAEGRAIWDGTTKVSSTGAAACQYMTAQRFYEVQKAAGVSDADIIADLTDQKANEDAPLLALIGSFTLASIDQLDSVRATTDPAAQVGTTTATLHGRVTLGSATTTTMSFVLGQSADLVGATTTVAAAPATVSGAVTDAAVSAALTGLSPATTYYYRIRGTFGSGEAEGSLEGAIRSFTTTGSAAQTITFEPVDDALLEHSPLQVSPASSAGLAVDIASSTPEVCTAAGFEVTLVEVGTCTLTATAPGNDTHAPAPPVTRSFTVSRGDVVPLPQTLTMPDLPDRLLPHAPFAVEVTSTSGLPPVLSSLSEDICTVAGGAVTLVAAGTCTLAADQPGDEVFLPAERVVGSFEVVRSPQTIAFSQPTDLLVGGPDVTLTPTSSSGLAVELSSATPAVCTVSGTTLTPVAVGVCEVTAAQPGNGSYLPATPVSRTLLVTPSVLPPAPPVKPAPPVAPTPAPPAKPTPAPPAKPTPAPVPPAPAPKPVPPAAPKGAVESGSAVSEGRDGRAAARTGVVSGVGRGSGAMTVSQLGGAPADPPPGAGDGDHFVVAVAGGSRFAGVELRVADSGGGALYWASPTGWRKLAGTRRDPATGELVVQIGAGTAPGLADLTELRLALGVTPVARVSGPERVGTSVAASRAAYAERGSARAAVLARSDVYADALTGGPLAAHKNGPLLLSEPRRLSPQAAAELRRVLPPGGTVYLLGGSAALAPAVEDAVRELGLRTVRVAGRDRFGTAVAIAGVLGHPETVFLASGRDFPDAVAAGPAAIASRGAVLLTEDADRNATTGAYLDGRGATTRFAVGGPAAHAHPEATALSGADRFETSARVAERFFDAPGGVGVTSGADSPDAIVAAPLLGRSQQPLLLSTRDALPEPVQGYLQPRSSSIVDVTVFGGAAAVAPTVVDSLHRALP